MSKSKITIVYRAYFKTKGEPKKTFFSTAMTQFHAVDRNEAIEIANQKLKDINRKLKKDKIGCITSIRFVKRYNPRTKNTK